MNATSEELFDASQEPELGDLITITSDLHGSVIGTIIYRDEELFRIRHYLNPNTATDYPIDPGTGMFQETLGVQELIIHEKRSDPHNSVQLGVIRGESIQFFDGSGNPNAPTAVVFEVYATDDQDAIKFEDGTIIDFKFRGPPPPYVILRAGGAPEAPPENNGVEYVPEPAAEPEMSFPDIDLALLPVSLVEEIPSSERTYSDTLQREDMFVSLLLDVPPKRQKDPKIMANLYRQTDVLLAMKNSMLLRDAEGAPTGAHQSYTPHTMLDILKRFQGVSIPALMSVAALKQRVYGDAEGRVELRSTVITNAVESLVNAAQGAADYETGSAHGNDFVTYINTVLSATRAFEPAVEGPMRVVADHDVFRTIAPPETVEGLMQLGKETKKEPVLVSASRIGSVKNHSVRILGANTITNPKTGTTFTVASADTAERYSTLLLPTSILPYRNDIRSGTLLWDVLTSEASRRATRGFYSACMAVAEEMREMTAESPTSLMSVVQERLNGIEALSNYAATRILDAIGLRTLEVSEELMKTYDTALESGQSIFDTHLSAIRAAVIDILAKPTSVAMTPAYDVASHPFFRADILAHPTLAKLFDTYSAKESDLRHNNLVRMSDILIRDGTTTLNYVSAVAAAVDEATLAARQQTMLGEQGRVARNLVTERSFIAKFVSAPEINPCAHVNELETIMNIRADEIKYPKFEKFLKRYGAGQKGNHILCSNCKLDLVCKHEVLLFQEFMAPGRSAALHKSLILDYAGPVFEGNYICKTCGQKISEIKYDSNLEFDDEGRPLMGRGVVETDENDDGIILRAEADAAIPFKDKEKKLYFQARAVFELCGFALEIDYYKRVVNALSAYVDAYVLSEPAHTASIERQKAAAEAKGARFIPQQYINYFSTQVVTAIGALCVLELQTNPINIPIPAQGCTLQRGGFPLEGTDPDVAGSGAIDYVSCAIASILRNEVPWNKTAWSAVTDMKKRVDAVRNGSKSALAKFTGIQLKGMPAFAPLGDITHSYTELLVVARNRLTAVATNSGPSALKASAADTLPPSFRPLPILSARPLDGSDAIGNAAEFDRNVDSKNISLLRPFVESRHAILTSAVVSGFHENASKEGVIQDNNPCSESVCCFRRLGAVGITGFGYSTLPLSEAVKAEYSVIAGASQRVERRDPATNNGGTHIYVPWSAPQRVDVLPTPDESTYYKLFLKHCFRGRGYGGVHEFNADMNCRNCEFALPVQLTYMTAANITETGKKFEAALAAMNQERERLALEAFAAAGITIDAISFGALESAIRGSKGVAIYNAPLPPDFLNVLQIIRGALVPLGEEAQNTMDALITGMTRIGTEGRVGPQRLSALLDFSRRYDTALAAFRERLTAHATQRRSVAGALDGFAKITGIAAGQESVRLAVSIFVTGGNVIANDWSFGKLKYKKWFPRINPSHLDALSKIWTVFNAVTDRAKAAIGEMERDDPRVDAIRTVLRRFTALLGDLLNVISTNIRTTVGFTDDESVRVVQWILVSCLSLLIDTGSPLLADSSLAERATLQTFFADWILDSSATFATAVDKYSMTSDEIKSRVAARTEQEKNMFIAKMDKLDMESRKLELMKKNLKIGDWSVGSKNLFAYNSDMFEFERSQRAAMGLPEFTEELTGLRDGAEEDDAGDDIGMAAGEEGGNMADGELHRAAQDEDDDGGIVAGRLHFVC